MAVRDVDRVAKVLGARADLRLSWNGEGLDRLLDADHARLVEVVASLLRRNGWEVAIEVTFWIRGERGSIDVLGWHTGARSVLVVEVKSVVPDHQAMLSALDRKTRLAIEIGRERGWKPIAAARLLAIRDTRTSRRRVDQLRETYAVAFSHRTLAVRQWIVDPDPTRPLSGLMFVSDVQGMSTRHRVARRPPAG